MTEQTEPSARAVEMAEDLLKHVDLQRFGAYATAATAALAIARRHPWVLVAAGTAAAFLGAWVIARRRQEEAEEARRRVAGRLHAGNGTN